MQVLEISLSNLEDIRTLCDLDEKPLTPDQCTLEAKRIVESYTYRLIGDLIPLHRHQGELTPGELMRKYNLMARIVMLKNLYLQICEQTGTAPGISSPPLD
jgi:hypothetical protein